MPDMSLRAAYLGPEGTFSHFAAQAFFGHGPIESIELVPFPDFPGVFEAVVQRQCHIGLVPLENSLRGTVGQSFDLFLEHDVRIVGELYEHISHCLLGGSAQTIGSVQAIYSHPQPLAQCEKWLRAHVPGVPMHATSSTAAAAQKALEVPCAAAIGHMKLAQLYGLRVLAHGIEDERDNWTRFVVIAREAEPATLAAALPPAYSAAVRERTSLLFTVADKPGALAAVLHCLAEGQINMRKLESRPLRQSSGENWKYAFFMDVECDMTASEHAATLGRLCSYTTMLRVLGSYPQGPYLSVTSQPENP